jgi:S1-C subfamily serine protease
VAVNGKNVDSVARMLAYLDDFKPGAPVRLSVWRDGKTVEITATLQTGETEI